MGKVENPAGGSEIVPGAVRDELARVLAGPSFAKVERPGRFLRHLVETALANEPHLLKESLLGVDVFDRQADWDPRLDPVVRQEAARLRKRLARHYETAPAEGVRIDLPVGTYVPVFRSPNAAAPAPSPAPPAPARWRKFAAAGALIAGIVAGMLWMLFAGARPHRPNAAAEEFYLRGLHEWQQRTPDSLTRAVDLFTQAIVRDPQYALAYVGLADCYNLLREFSVMPEREAYPRALAATQKALELDNRSAEAHASLAFISWWWNWKPAEAEREFRRALALNPGYGTAHHWYATFLSCRGRHPEALEQIEAAQKIDPASVSILADKALLLYSAGRAAEARALLAQLELESGSLRSVHRYLAAIALIDRDYPRYLSELDRSAESANDPAELAIWKAASQGYAQGGEQRMFESILREQLALHERGLLNAYLIAQTYALMGRAADAVRMLDASTAEPGSFFLGYASDPALARIRSDPAYRALDTRIARGLAQGTLPPPH